MVRKNTWIVLGVFAALAGLIVLLPYLPEKTDTVEALPAVTLPPQVMQFPLFGDTFGAEDIVELSVFVGVELELHLSWQEDEVWALVVPIADSPDEVDLERVELTLMQLTRFYAIPLEETVDDLAVVGLAEPAYKVNIGLADGSTVIFLIGDETPLGSAYFVQVDGGDVVMVDTFYIAALQGILDVPPIIQPAP